MLSFAAALGALARVASLRADDLVVQGANSPYVFSTGTASYDSIYVGQSADGTLNQSGGTLSAATGQLFLGYGAGVTGIYNLSGGTLNTISTDVGDSGTGVFTLTGSGVHNVTGVDGSASGSLDLGYFAGSNGTYNLNGGTLNAGFVRGNQGTSTFNFGGGTLTAGASATDFFQSLTHAYVGSGATINTAGFDVTVAQNLEHTNASGAAATDGGLTKTGAGTLTLSGVNTYTGITSVTAGALAVTGRVNSPSANLRVSGSSTAAATLSLSGTGSLSVGSAYVGINGVGTINQSGGSFTTNGSTLILGFGQGGSGTYNLSGTGSGLSTGAAYVGYFGTGTINQSGGSFTTNGSTLILGYNVGSGTYNLSGGALTTGATEVGEDNEASSFTQIGGTHTTGTLALAGSTTNSQGTYALAGGTLHVSSVQGGPGTSVFHFAGGMLQAGGNTATLLQGLTTVDVQGNGGAKIDTAGFNVTVAQSLVHDTTNAASAIDGGLTKLGGGTLTLSGANTYTGATTVSAGTLQAGVATAAGTSGAFGVNSAVTLANVAGVTLDLNGFNTQIGSLTGGGSTGGNVTLGGATLTVGADNTSPAAYAGVISGAGSLVKLGGGTLTLSGANTYTGATTVSAGTLSVAMDANLGATGNPVTVLGGASLVFTGSTPITARTFNLVNATLSPASGGSLTYAGATVNGGTLGAGNQILADGTTLNGVRTTTGTVLSQNGGTVTFNNVTLSGGSTFAQATGATLNTTGDFLTTSPTTVTVNGTVSAAGGSISGALTINNGATVNSVGGSSAPLYLDGSRGTTINAGGKLSAASGSTVELGGLLVNDGTQTGTLNVNLGGVARGSGTFGAVNVGQGGYFGPNALTTGGAVTTNALPVFRLTGTNALTQTAAALVGPQPNATPATANVLSLALGSGSVFALSIQDAQGATGQGYDTVRASGTLTLAAGTAAGNRITVSVSSLNSGGTAGAAANFDPSRNYTFVLVQADGSIGGYNPAEFVVDASSFQNNTQGGSFSVVQAGNNLDLVFTSAVPEPGTWALLSFGVGWLGVVAMRRRPA